MKYVWHRLFQCVIIALMISYLSSCKKKSVANVEIGQTLYLNQGFFENRRLINLIDRTLNNDDKALAELISFPCGGAAGCYDLGFIITQIIYAKTHQDFLNLASDLDYNQIKQLRALIEVGLEYGDHDKDGQVDYRSTEVEFLEISEELERRLKDTHKY